MRCIMSLESNGVKNPIGRVAFLWSPPSLHWRSSGANPYAGLLAEELAGHGVRVDARSDTNLRFVWTFPRSYDVIHFNWIPRLYEHQHESAVFASFGRCITSFRMSNCALHTVCWRAEYS